MPGDAMRHGRAIVTFSLLAPGLALGLAFAAHAQPGNDEKVCLAQVPASAQAQVEACSALLATGRYNERNRAIIHSNRGVAQRARRDLAVAIADYDEAIRLYPEFARAYVNRGNAHYDRQDYDRAIADLDQAVRLDARSASAFISRGNAWDAKGDADRAIADYTAALELTPNSAIAHFNRGLVLRRKGQLDRAL